MKVKELIKHLQSMPEDQTVFLAYHSSGYTNTDKPVEVFQHEGCTIIGTSDKSFCTRYMDISNYKQFSNAKL